jgi:hypothetical protein
LKQIFEWDTRFLSQPGEFHPQHVDEQSTCRRPAPVPGITLKSWPAGREVAAKGEQNPEQMKNLNRGPNENLLPDGPQGRRTLKRMRNWSHPSWLQLWRVALVFAYPIAV